MAIGVASEPRWFRGWFRARRAASGAEAGAAATLAGATLARAVLAACLVGAAAVHFAFAPAHFEESRVHGTFFAVVGWAQVALGIGVLVTPARRLLRAVILVDVGLALVWATSRLVGMPFGDDPWVPEPVGVPDAVAVGLGLLAAGVAFGLLWGWWSASTVSRGLARTGGVLLGALLVGLTTASVAPALAGSHTHAGAHDHASGPAGSGGGSGGGSGTGAHEHAPRATGVGAAVAGPGGIEAANGTSPCEQSGASGEGGTGAGGHGHHGASTQQAVTDPATRALLGQQLSAARAAALQYPTAADALAAGYRKVTNYIPCIAAHYMRFTFVDATFDPSAPEMLLYDGNGADARIVGLSYYVSGTTTAPEGFAGPNDPWHQHIGLCVRNGVVVGGTQLTEAECAARGGVKADGSTAWMVHAWVVPGWESAWGTFSAEHPELGALLRR